MLYILTMKEIATKEACNILRVHKFTLYRWADQGKVKMRRVPPLNYRVFDYDDIKKVATKLPKQRGPHNHLFPKARKK